jgi:hypothetical protein
VKLPPAVERFVPARLLRSPAPQPSEADVELAESYPSLLAELDRADNELRDARLARRPHTEIRSRYDELDRLLGRLTAAAMAARRAGIDPPEQVTRSWGSEIGRLCERRDRYRLASLDQPSPPTTDLASPAERGASPRAAGTDFPAREEAGPE